jgi:hypothetical protein
MDRRDARGDPMEKRVRLFRPRNAKTLNLKMASQARSLVV